MSRGSLYQSGRAKPRMNPEEAGETPALGSKPVVSYCSSYITICSSCRRTPSGHVIRCRECTKEMDFLYPPEPNL